MKFEDLEMVEDLTQYPWDAAALFCLEHGCLRYSELHESMESWGDRNLTESELTRTLSRLVRRHMTSVAPGGGGHNVYGLTDAGRSRLGRLQRLMEAAPHLDPPGQRRPAGRH